MSWNDDSGNSNQKDPWNGKNKNQGPPDLDKALKQLMNKFAGLFSFGKKSSKPGGGNEVNEVRHAWLIILVIVVILVIIWFLSGFYIVGPADQAVVLRFGKYNQTQNSGMHWIPRFVDSKTIVNIQEINNFTYESEMLTEDENIVSVEIAVQYQIQDPMKFLYNVAEPVVTIQQATASALRQVVGNMSLDAILTTGRQTLSDNVNKQLNQTIQIYQTGIRIVAVTLQPTKPPEQVTAAFNDAIKAREDEQRYQNQAQAYASKVVPIAQGQVKRILAQAKAYEQQIVLDATANVARFNAILPTYEKAPKVTRDRMYYSAIESMLKHSSKVLMSASNKNIAYLPLNKIITMAGAGVSDTQPSDEAQVAASASTVTTSQVTPSANRPSAYSSKNLGYFQQTGGQ